MLPNNIKQKTTEEKIQLLKEYLSNENTDDKILALNIFLLIKHNNSFDDSFFTHEDVIFNDIMEFIDIIDELKNDLKRYTEKLLGIYISCIKNCNLSTFNVNNICNIPLIYLHVLYMMDYMTLSSLCNNFDCNDDDSIYSESYEVVVNLSNKISCFSMLLDSNLETLGLPKTAL